MKFNVKSALPALVAASTLFALSGCVVAADEAAPTSASTSNEDTSSSESSDMVDEVEEVEVEASTSSASAGVGGTVSVEGIEYTLNSVRSTSEDSLSGSPVEDIYLILDLTIANTTDEDLISSTLVSFDLKGSDAYAYDLSIFVDTKGSLDGTVPAGDVLRGEIAFDVPNLDSYKLTVTPGFISDSASFEILSSDIG